MELLLEFHPVILLGFSMWSFQIFFEGFLLNVSCILVKDLSRKSSRDLFWASWQGLFIHCAWVFFLSLTPPLIHPGFPLGISPGFLTRIPPGFFFYKSFIDSLRRRILPEFLQRYFPAFIIYSFRDSFIDLCGSSFPGFLVGSFIDYSWDSINFSHGFLQCLHSFRFYCRDWGVEVQVKHYLLGAH